MGRKAQVYLLDGWCWRGIEGSDVIGGTGIDRVSTKVDDRGVRQELGWNPCRDDGRGCGTLARDYPASEWPKGQSDQRSGHRSGGPVKSSGEAPCGGVLGASLATQSGDVDEGMVFSSTVHPGSRVLQQRVMWLRGSGLALAVLTICVRHL